MAEEVTELVIRGRQDQSLEALEQQLTRIRDLAREINDTEIGPSGGRPPPGPGGAGPGGGGGGSGGSGGGGGRGGGSGGGDDGQADPEEENQRRFGPMRAAALAIPVLGGVAAALIAEYIRTASIAEAYDAQAAASRGLFGGQVTGASIRGAGSGAGMTATERLARRVDLGTTQLGFTPQEAEGIFQQAATAGLGAQETERLARVAAQFERIGLGAGAAVSFGGAFRAGGGAGAGDAQSVIGMALAEAVRSGVEMARMPEYLALLEQSMTRLAAEGIDVDPGDMLRVAGMLTGVSGGAGAFAGTRALAAAERMRGIGESVRGGGGSPLQQYLMLQAAGLGTRDPETGEMIDLLEARARLSEGRIDPSRIIGMTQRPGGALLMSDQGFFSERQAQALARGRRPGAVEPLAGMGGLEVVVQQLIAEGVDPDTARGIAGSAVLSARAEQATSGTQRATAGLAVRELATGQKALPSFIDARTKVRGATQAGVDSIVTPVVEKTLSAIDSIGAVLSGQKSAFEALTETVLGTNEAMKKTEKTRASKRSMVPH